MSTETDTSSDDNKDAKAGDPADADATDTEATDTESTDTEATDTEAANADAAYSEIVESADDGDNESDKDGVEVLDLTDSAGRLRQHMPLFDIYCGNLAKKVSVALQSYIQFPLKVTADKPRVCTFDAISPHTDQPLFDRLYRYPDLGGLIALSVPSGLTYRLVDILFGGRGDVESDEENRELSPTENNMMEVVSNALLAALNELLESATVLQSELEVSAWSYQQAAKAGTSESMIVIPFSIDMGESSGTLEMWFSLSVLELLLGVKLLPHQDGEKVDPNWSGAFKKQVFCCPLDLKCTLTEMSMPLSRVGQLAVGDFIPVPDIGEAVFSVETLPLFKAKVGVANEQASASFLRWI